MTNLLMDSRFFLGMCSACVYLWSITFSKGKATGLARSVLAKYIIIVLIYTI